MASACKYCLGDAHHPFESCPTLSDVAAQAKAFAGPLTVVRILDAFLDLKLPGRCAETCGVLACRRQCASHTGHGPGLHWDHTCEVHRPTMDSSPEAQANSYEAGLREAARTARFVASTIAIAPGCSAEAVALDIAHRIEEQIEQRSRR